MGIWLINACFGLAALAAVVGGGCTRQSEQDVVQIQITSEPVSLDPALAEDGISLRILANLMDGLVGYDGAGNRVNRLASAVEISKDGLRYAFTIVPDARWSDGEPVRAAHFVAGLRRLLTPATGSKLAALFDPIRGARAFRLGKGTVEQVGVRDDGGKVVIDLERPAPYFLDALTLASALPVREDILAAHGGRWPESAPVTGHYRIREHRTDRTYELEPNPHYYGAKAKSRVLLRVVTDESTALSLFESGKLDVVMRIPTPDFARLKAAGQVRVDPFWATYFLAFNLRRPVVQDIELRQAISGAIDREGIVAALGSGETPARSWVSVGLEGGEAWGARSASARLSTQLPAKFAKLPVVDLGYDSGARNSLILEKVQSDLKNRLGLKIELKPLDWKSHVRSLHADAPSMYRYGWQAPFADPITHLEVFTTGNPNNAAGFSDARYDQLVREISEMPSGAARVEKIRVAQNILTEEQAVVIPLYHYVQAHAVSKRLAGFKVNPFGLIPYWELSLVP